MVTVLKRDLVLLFIFVFFDQLTTYIGVFHYNLEEGNIIGRFIFQNFGRYGIFLTFLHEFFSCLGLFIFYRFLREKVFKTKIQAEYIAIFAPLVVSIYNAILILLNH